MNKYDSLRNISRHPSGLQFLRDAGMRGATSEELRAAAISYFETKISTYIGRLENGLSLEGWENERRRVLSRIVEYEGDLEALKRGERRIYFGVEV